MNYDKEDDHKESRDEGEAGNSDDFFKIVNQIPEKDLKTPDQPPDKKITEKIEKKRRLLFREKKNQNKNSRDDTEKPAEDLGIEELIQRMNGRTQGNNQDNNEILPSICDKDPDDDVVIPATSKTDQDEDQSYSDKDTKEKKSKKKQILPKRQKNENKTVKRIRKEETKPEQENKHSENDDKDLLSRIEEIIESVVSRFVTESIGEMMETIPFDIGETKEPQPVDSLKTVDIAYPVDPPHQYIRVFYDKEDRALRYQVLEPELSRGEEHCLIIIKNAFQKMISTDLKLISGEKREEYLHARFSSIIEIFGLKLTEDQRNKIFFHMRKQYLGYDRIDSMMKDRYIEDISCNGAEMDLYVQHRTFGPIRTNIRFENVELNNFVLKLAQISGRHISLLQPIRDITLPDGSRGNLTLGGEVTKKGSTFTIRKFRSNPISAIELMDYGTIGSEQLAFLWLLMEYKRSLLVSGGTASGKTTLLNVLCSFIPIDYKVVSIEDTAELNLMHPNWLQSITRTGFGGSSDAGSPSGIGGGGGGKAPGDISLYDLLIAALRQRPEFILVGEVRGSESFTLFQAIAVGHAAMGTIHAGTMDELLSRIESNPMNVPRSLFCNLDAVIFPMQIKRGELSIRRVVSIVEILELDRDTHDLVTNTVFKWNPEEDAFVFSGKSYLFDKIRETFGVDTAFLLNEMKDRAYVLEWMKKTRVRDYREALKVIRMYYKDKEELFKNIEDGNTKPWIRIQNNKTGEQVSLTTT
ncbi:type II secretion system protein E [Methanolacinia petrolearia DSM 11571]|uniref:Type II secretion system protein E n=1 Tax=Methanolacinia petrolearia (strain DSM 11571 / OCM 486 / SEBR 4847) TaxID=679926 RepID=E1RG75_METP4|nr:type II/IV secretion system ATPase subunit [Methanolacinia petrolearia]ADN37389.1 type II secretion system protein E [Methanolacinia petrolearia DSM 11571]